MGSECLEKAPEWLSLLSAPLGPSAPPRPPGLHVVPGNKQREVSSPGIQRDTSPSPQALGQEAALRACSPGWSGRRPAVAMGGRQRHGWAIARGHGTRGLWWFLLVTHRC